MSSIIIKGMQMPSECRGCPLCQYYPTVGETRCRMTGEVMAYHFGVIKFSGRSEHCQLVELPEKHGRLVDADAFSEHLQESAENFGTFAPQIAMALEAAIRDLKDPKKTPTIVEAEGEEDKECTT